MYYNLKKLGRTKNFSQSTSLNYKIPIDKFPLLDWINSTAKYSARYQWNAGSFQQADTLGNIIENGREYSLTTKLDINNLYNKLPIFRNYTKKFEETDTTNTLFQSRLFDGIMKMIMSVKSINLTYNVSERTALAGIVDSPGLFGKNTISSSPGWDFIFGSQDSGIRQLASERGWLVKNDYLNTPFLQSRNHNFQFRSSIEPLSGFRIQLDANRLVSENFQEIFRYNSISDSYISLTPGRGGNFSLSFLAIKTAFVKGDNLKNSPTFEKFVNNNY